MNKLMKTGIFLICILPSQFLSAQEKKISELTKDDFVADFELAMNILKKTHPNPYKFKDSLAFNHQADSLRQELEKNPTFPAFLKIMNSSMIPDVHLSASVSEKNEEEWHKASTFFPYPVIIERGRMFINIQGKPVPFGSEVVSINGITTKQILKEFDKFSLSDGYIATGSDRNTWQFQRLFSLIYPPAKFYDLHYLQDGSSKVLKARLTAANATIATHNQQQLRYFPINILQQSDAVYDEFYEKEKTGVLTVNTFQLNEAKAYESFSAFFKEMNKRDYKNVIIDIRNNGGGDPAISSLLYSFLSHGKFENRYNFRTRTLELPYSSYLIDHDSRGLSEEDIKARKNFFYQRFDKDSSGIYIGNNRLNEGFLTDYPQDKDAFHGHVYLLTGGGTVSAATYFATLVQRNKRGHIIGKETGSGKASTAAHSFDTYRLPGTNSTIKIPLMEIFFFDAKEDNGRGVIPDTAVPIEKYIHYVRQKKDPELSLTFEIIKKALK